MRMKKLRPFLLIWIVFTGGIAPDGSLSAGKHASGTAGTFVAFGKGLPGVSGKEVPGISASQQGRVSLLTFRELEARISQQSDTTYLVNFWATWCAPCLKELPHFDRLQRSYSSEKVKVLLVSLDFRSQLETGVIPFVEKKDVYSEVLLLDEPDQAAIINRISPDWSGALPATLAVNAASGARRFHEGTFTYEELESFYLLTKN